MIMKKQIDGAVFRKLMMTNLVKKITRIFCNMGSATRGLSGIWVYGEDYEDYCPLVSDTV